jgi:hypothetical protein
MRPLGVSKAGINQENSFEARPGVHRTGSIIIIHMLFNQNNLVEENYDHGD